MKILKILNFSSLFNCLNLHENSVKQKKTKFVDRRFLNKLSCSDGFFFYNWFPPAFDGPLKTIRYRESPLL